MSKLVKFPKKPNAKVIVLADYRRRKSLFSLVNYRKRLIALQESIGAIKQRLLQGTDRGKGKT